VTGRVVVFGGSGFIGSSLRSGLHRDLVAPSRSEVDLTSLEALASYLRQGDIVVNAAGYAAATDRSAAGLRRLRRDNVEAVGTLGQAAAAAEVDRIIHISSVAAMGHRTGHMITEQALLPPRTPYGQSKRDGELVLLARAGDVPVTIIRPTSIFGEGRGLAALLCRLTDLPVIPVVGGGSALVPFSYVGNLVAAVDRLIDHPVAGRATFIVGDATSYPLLHIVRTLASALGRPGAPVVPIPTVAVRGLGRVESAVSRRLGRLPLLDPARVETLTSSISYSTAAFIEATGFEPPYPLETALARIATWYRDARPASA
jgi:nucleoside-diphosphate-sugar epimerase